MLWHLATAHTAHIHAQFTGETTPHNTLPNHHIDLATKTLAALLSLSLCLSHTHGARAPFPTMAAAVGGSNRAFHAPHGSAHSQRACAADR